MSDTFASTLRAELVTAAGRRHAQRVRRRRAATLLSVGVLLITGLIASSALLRTDRAAAGVDIRVENGRLLVRLTDLESRPDVIRDALADAGLHATVTGVPVGPSDIGRFVGQVATTPPPELARIDARGSTFAGFTIPVGWPGELDLLVGRAATSGEQYLTPSNAFAAGEPLACVAVVHVTLAEAAGRLPSGINIRVLAFSESGAPASPEPLEHAVQSHPSLLVASAEALSVSDVVILATPDGSSELGPAPPTDVAC